MGTIGIRQLRQHASAHVAAAARGEEVVITDRGVPVARLVRLSPLELRLHELAERHGILPPRVTGSVADLDLGDGIDVPLTETLEDQRAERLP